MLIILSGQYVESELASEFGAIPPSFLPVGNKRLYTYQIDRFRPFYDEIVITLPYDFVLEEPDRDRLSDWGVLIYRTPAQLSIGEVVRQLLGQLGVDGRIDILYGDTLIQDSRVEGSDWLVVAESDEFYQWHYEDDENREDEEQALAWCGMFSFSDSKRLRVLLDKKHDFNAAVEAYGRTTGLERRRTGQWLDFGHVHTYYKSKLSATTQRHFNRLSINDGVITKSSQDKLKMAAEAAWFERAPPCIRRFLPNYIGRADEGGYSLEYLPLAALNELFVFGHLPPKVWNSILGACVKYLEAAAAIPVMRPFGLEEARATYLDKTAKRLAEFHAQTAISLDEGWNFNGKPVPGLLAMAHEMGAEVMKHPPTPAFIHGDLCFSNILFDFRSGRVKLIDPRGLDAQGEIGPFGDLRYDIGKLSHSVLGLYDMLIAGHFRLDMEGNSVSFSIMDGHTAALGEVFARQKILGRLPREWDCYPVMVLLFLSMLPLHVDNPLRQKALLANAMRLYLEAQT